MGKLMRSQVLVSIVALIFTSGCMIAPMKPGVPIETEGTSFLNRHYKQNGVTISETSIMSELKKSEKTAAKASSAEMFYWVSMIAAGVGGFCLGSALGSSTMSTDQKNSNLLASIGLIGVSMGGMYYVDQNLTEAIEGYHGGLDRKKSGVTNPKARVSFLQNGVGLSLGWSY